MSYIDKDGFVESFPNNRRNTNKSRNMTELAFIRITNNLVDVDGWVISNELNERVSSYFEFCIHGYYFKVLSEDLRKLIGQSWNNVYATIKVENNELIGQDTVEGVDREIYDGVNFTNYIPTSPTEELYTLKILEKVGGIWIVPESSKVKFNGDSLDLIVDGEYIQ